MKALVFKPKNLVVEAFQYGIDEPPSWFLSSSHVSIRPDYCLIDNFGSLSKAEFGDYVMQSLNKEIFACREKIFNKVFEAIER